MYPASLLVYFMTSPSSRDTGNEMGNVFHVKVVANWPMKVRDVNIQGSTEVQMRQEALKDPKPLHNMSSSDKGVSRFSRTSQRDFIKANQSLKALVEI